MLQSQTPVEQGGCGTVTYDLSFYANDGYNDYSGDAGYYTVSGACYAYTDCNCNYPDGDDSGSIGDGQDGGPGEGYIDFWWWAVNVEEYQYSACTSGQCQNSGAVPQPVYYYDDYVAYSTMYC